MGSALSNLLSASTEQIALVGNNVVSGKGGP